MLKISLKCGIVTITIPENLSLEEKGKQNSKDKPRDSHPLVFNQALS